jgi:hypothetical protein
LRSHAVVIIAFSIGFLPVGVATSEMHGSGLGVRGGVA